MKRIPLILLMFFCAIVPKTQAEVSAELIEKFELFNACNPVRLAVADLSPDAKKINLTKEAIINSVESRLRSGRILSDKSIYLLYTVVSVTEDAFAIQLKFYKRVRDYHFPDELPYGPAITWSTGSFGIHDKTANYILSALSVHVDKFLVEYFRVNEKACNKIR